MTFHLFSSNFSYILDNCQYLARLNNDTCCSAHCKNVSYATRINDEGDFSRQAQYLVKLRCHFSWQAQYSVKFGMIDGVRNVVFCNRKCSRSA